VTPAEAADLLRLLRAAYPEAKRKVGQDTADLWLGELRRLDTALGDQAVRSLIASARRWPSIAELHEQIEVARRQTAQTERDRERQRADEIAEELPRPPLEEIPAVQELLDRWSETFGLPDAPAGKCGHCGKEAKRRFVLGQFTLCHDCTRSRRSVGAAAGAAQGLQRRRDPVARPPERERERQRRRRLPTTCRLCRRKLKAYERPEGICDECLRAHPSGVRFPDPEDNHAAEGRQEGDP
jgi:hypothetical protein